MAEAKSQQRVVYLFGAGASHGCIKAVNSAYGILMRDLTQPLADEVHSLAEIKYKNHQSLRALVNDVIDENTDFEHIITFLDESPSSLHRLFAEDLRKIFESVLRKRLADIEAEQERVPDDLYVALLDMHRVPNLPEELVGFLTINYDGYLDHAIQQSAERTLDSVVELEAVSVGTDRIKVINLHGSFSWRDAWPIRQWDGESTLWIPPGIQKAKERYPFNLLWGRARELLNCDLLRIIGCGLGPNDWDLISLLFTTRHTNATRHPYSIEVIDAPCHALQLRKLFPYLGIQSLLEVEPIGSHLVSELIGGKPRAYNDLTTRERERVIEAAGTGRNWFRLWLQQKGEALVRQLGSVETNSGAFQRFLEESQI